jgi:hypothetical protein
MSEKSNRIFLCISFILILTLVPVLQALPLSLPPLLPEASAQSGIGPIVINSFKNNSATVTTSPFTATITNFNAGVGNSRLLVVAVEADNKSVNSVTFNGGGTTQSLSQASGSFQNDYTAFWYLKNPVGTGTVTVTMAGAAQVIVGAYALSGVDQANPIPTTATNFTKANSPVNPSPTITLTTEYPDSIVLDSAALYGGSKLTGSGCGHLEWSKQMLNKVTGASSNTTRVLAGPVTCKWTNSVVQNGWDDTAIEVKAIGSAPQVSPITLSGKSTASGFVPKTSSTVTLYNFSAGTGANRLLVVGVAADTQSVNGITFGGATLTQKASSFVNNDAEIWILKNPSSKPANLVVTMSGNTQHLSQFVVGAYAFSGVNQTTPISNTAANHGAVVGSPTVTITTQNANDWVVDLPSIFGGTTLSSPTCVPQWNSNVQYNSTNAITGASSSTLVPTTGSVTCKWTASTAEFWDDAAVDIHAVSLQASTGILEPTYCDPYTSDPSPCATSPTFTWQPILSNKTAHANVPYFVIVNPDNGPGPGNPPHCASNGTGVNRTRDYDNGIGNLTNAGVIVLGYVYTGFGAQPYSTATADVDKWVSCYPKIQGIFMDVMAYDSVTSHIDYYQNLTNYIHNKKGLTYSIGNAGAQTIQQYVNSGAADNIVINETNVNATYHFPITSDLQTDTFSTSTGNIGYDKHDFSFLVWNETTVNGGLPNSVTLDNRSNYVGLLYVTDDCGVPHPCTPDNNNPWGAIASYIGNLVAELDNKTSVITVNSTGPSSPVGGLLVQISQKGNVVPSGYTPYSYLGTQGVTYTFTPQNSTSCTFNHWKDTGTGPAARTITVTSTSKAYTAVYTGTSCK